MFSLAFLLCIYITKLPNNYNAVLVRKESRTLVYWTSNYGIIYFALILTTLTNDLVLQICVKVQLIMLITSAKLHNQAQFFLVFIIFVSFLCFLFRSWGFWKDDQQICFNSSFYNKNQDLYFPSCESMCLDKNDKRCIIINTILGQIQGFVFRS